MSAWMANLGDVLALSAVVVVFAAALWVQAHHRS
jgi:hypothetical protein